MTSHGPFCALSAPTVTVVCAVKLASKTFTEKTGGEMEIQMGITKIAERHTKMKGS